MQSGGQKVKNFVDLTSSAPQTQQSGTPSPASPPPLTRTTSAPSRHSSRGGGMSSADRNEAQRLQDEQDGLQEKLEYLSKGQSDAAQHLGDISNDYAVARNEYESRRAQAEAAQRQLDEYRKNFENQKDQLDIARVNWESALRLAQFFRDHAINKLREDMEQALLQAWCEARNNMWEAFCTAIESIMHLGIAIAGGVSPKNAIFDRHQYFVIKEPEKDQSPQYFAQAQSQWENFQKQKEYLEQKEGDPFYINRLNEAQRDLAYATNRYSKLSQERDEARNDADNAADSVNDAQRELRKVNRELRGIYEKYKK